MLRCQWLNAWIASGPELAETTVYPALWSISQTSFRTGSSSSTRRMVLCCIREHSFPDQTRRLPRFMQLCCHSPTWRPGQEMAQPNLKSVFGPTDRVMSPQRFTHFGSTHNLEIK